MEQRNSKTKRDTGSMGGAESRGYSLAELSKKKFAPLRFYVEGMLVEGLTLLAGRPKKGKSWMALGMGIDIANGDETLGDLGTKQSNVIYYALEDNKRRLFRRGKVLLGDNPWPQNFHVIHELKKTDAGGLRQIEDDVEQYRGKVVFIDTLTAIKPKQLKGIDPYQNDYHAIAELQKLAHKLRICLVLIYHTRKAFADDPQELIQGTTGITGAVDSWFVLNVTSEVAELHGGGRDIENVEWGMKHGINARWRIVGEARDMRKSQQRRDVLKVLRAANGADVKVVDIVAAVKRSDGATRKLLHDMERSGDILRTRHGFYRVVKR